MDQTQIKWGVIGAGGIALRRTIPEGIIPAENASLNAVFDIDQDSNSYVAQTFQAKQCSSIEDLLSSDIEAVYVASPVNTHLEHVLACAAAGKHVLCEKPLGMNVAEAERMIEACRAAGVNMGAAFMMRFQSQHQEALKMIEKGKLGVPVFARAQLSCWYPPIKGAWRQDPSLGGGGALLDMGSHCIDLLEMFLGKVEAVSCFTNNSVHNYKSEDSAIVSARFANGALATVDTFFCIPDSSSKNALEIYGSKGSLLAKGTLGQGNHGEMTAFLEGETSAYNAQQTRNSAGGIIIEPEPINPYLAEIQEFSAALKEKRDPENHASIGLQSQKVMAACYRSANSGCVEKIS